MTLPVDPSKYSAFLIAMFVMAISPGPANLYSIATGRVGKPAQVFAAVAGINLATLIWFIAAALGLQALIVAFPKAFQVLGVLGALYLGFIGYKTITGAFKDSGALNIPQGDGSLPLAATFGRGFWVQMLNPKVTLFFTAVLPPFIDTNRPTVPQMSVFALTAIGMDVMAMTGYGLGAVALSGLLNQPENRKRFDLFVGLLLSGIAVMIFYHALNDLLKPH